MSTETKSGQTVNNRCWDDAIPGLEGKDALSSLSLFTLPLAIELIDVIPRQTRNGGVELSRESSGVDVIARWLT